ncbi:hypothetical protein [Prosthecobacter fluviatilis]|uniref:ABC-type transport system involved in multi-copper enzyme maturation, permease component n=1 Tax=Prosthecobacter fluviatilis TaxID=445931 RepID=A0ABW0KS45_9BACT
MTLHQFLKEFRYLRLRLLAFLGLLGFDLAVNLEWVLPMRAGVASPGWLTYVPVVILLAGLSLLISCPEDRPGTDRSFISTRPMPAKAYWTARLLIWLLLIVLPVVVQNGLYLIISGRPAADVLRGMWERLCFAAGFSAWLLPTLVLWKRSELWKMLLTVVLVLVGVSKMLDVAGAAWWEYYASYYQTWAGRAAGWVVFAVMSGVLAWRHLSQRFSFKRRLGMTLVAGLVALLTARFWSWQDSPPEAQDAALVKKLSSEFQFHVDLSKARFEGPEKSYGPRLTAEVNEETHMQGVHVVFRPQRSDLAQGGSVRHVERTEKNPYRRSPFDSPQMEVFRGDRNLRDFFPKGTLLMANDEYFPKWTLKDQPLTQLAAFSAPHPKFDEPLSIETDFVVDWYRRDLALDVPVAAGAKGTCEDVRWEILRVMPAAGPQPGALTVSLRVESRAHWVAENGHAILLHLPEQRMLRLEPTKQVIAGERGEHTGWRHQQVDLTWNYIFNHAEGDPTGADLSKARLILLRSRYLGQTQQHWKSPEMRLADLPSNWGKSLQWFESKALYAGREMKAFQERMATLTPPTAESTEKEARRYVYDLFSAASVTQAVYTYAAHPLIAEAFEPLGRHHLPLMLDLRGQSWPGWSNKPPNNQLERYVTEEQRELLIDRAPSQAMLADLVVRKGWAEAAKRLKPQILSSVVLPPGADELLIAWKDDPDAAERMLKEAPNDFNGGLIHALDKVPERRPAVEAVVSKQFEDTVPLIPSNKSARALSRAAEFGSAEAFALCLRWLSIGGDLTSRSVAHPYLKLLNADGSNFWDKRMPVSERWPFFRRLKVEDCEYVPEKRAWKIRQL